MRAMQPTTCIRLCGVFGGLSVALGALAAHAMQGRFPEPALDVFEKAVRYELYHALALGLCGLLGLFGRRGRGASWCFLAGIVLFSGSLYGYVLLDVHWLVHVTPFGGVSFLAGWTLLAVNGARRLPSHDPRAV
jgi:uncharacterized membrane protein YgdD (TMEM256/DUF423 family)